MGKYCDYDLHVFGPKAFYPVAWPDWKDIFKVRRENTPGTRKTERGWMDGCLWSKPPPPVNMCACARANELKPL